MKRLNYYDYKSLIISLLTEEYEQAIARLNAQKQNNNQEPQYTKISPTEASKFF